MTIHTWDFQILLWQKSLTFKAKRSSQSVYSPDYSKILGRRGSGQESYYIRGLTGALSANAARHISVHLKHTSSKKTKKKKDQSQAESVHTWAHTHKMGLTLCWPTIPGHGACSRIWLLYLVGRKVRRIWEKLREGKECEQNILYKNVLIKTKH